jgi:hypothetical protein
MVKTFKESRCVLRQKRTSKDELDVHGSVHHGIIHKENPTKCNSVSKFYFILI